MLFWGRIPLGAMGGRIPLGAMGGRSDAGYGHLSRFLALFLVRSVTL